MLSSLPSGSQHSAFRLFGSEAKEEVQSIGQPRVLMRESGILGVGAGKHSWTRVRRHGMGKRGNGYGTRKDGGIVKHGFLNCFDFLIQIRNISLHKETNTK